MSKDRETLEEKYARIKAKRDKELAQVDAQIKAKTAREKTAQRKRDTRRKIILGGLCRVHMSRNPSSDFAKRMIAMIDEYTIGDRERALFDLEPLPKEEQTARRARHRAERQKRGDPEAPF